MTQLPTAWLHGHRPRHVDTQRTPSAARRDRDGARPLVIDVRIVPVLLRGVGYALAGAVTFVIAAAIAAAPTACLACFVAIGLLLRS